MAGNQFQGDYTFIVETGGDRAAKIQNLEHEVHVIKTSIKSMLINIRDCMNDRTYAFTPYISAHANASPGAIQDSTLAAREAAIEARESRLAAVEASIATKAIVPEPRNSPAREIAPSANDVIKAATSRPHVSEHYEDRTAMSCFGNKKLEFQKIHQLFSWTNGAVRKFGHDRLAIMLESYCVMGYLPRKMTDEIREMSRIMPANLGDACEVGPDEFVCEIYALNRIFAPEDTSFDRDMIEVLMEQRQQGLARSQSSAKTGVSSGISARGKKPALRNYQIVEEWINLPI